MYRTCHYYSEFLNHQIKNSTDLKAVNKYTEGYTIQFIFIFELKIT